VSWRAGGDGRGVAFGRIPWHEEYRAKKDAEEQTKREKLEADQDAYARMKRKIDARREQIEGTCPFCSKPNAGELCDDDHCRELGDDAA
jgi:hypothetical protein